MWEGEGESERRGWVQEGSAEGRAGRGKRERDAVSLTHEYGLLYLPALSHGCSWPEVRTSVYAATSSGLDSISLSELGQLSQTVQERVSGGISSVSRQRHLETSSITDWH